MRRQVGGDHYQRLEIEPLDFFKAVNEEHYEGFLRMNIMKYIARYTEKHGGPAADRLALDDILKAQHYCELLADHLRSKIFPQTKETDQ